MSKWEDTVMSEERIKVIWYGVISTADKLPKIPDLVSVVAKAQAEISFKVGYEQSVLDNDNWARQDYGYQLGIREVVKWIGENSWDGSLQHFGSGNYRVQCVPPDDWLARLKEWGI